MVYYEAPPGRRWSRGFLTGRLNLWSGVGRETKSLRAHLLETLKLQSTKRLSRAWREKAAQKCFRLRCRLDSLSWMSGKKEDVSVWLHFS